MEETAADPGVVEEGEGQPSDGVPHRKVVVATLADVAAVLRVGVRQIQRYVSEKAMPGKVAKGFDLAQIVPWFLRTRLAEVVRAAPAPDGSGGQGDLLEWSIRAEAADAQIKELKLQNLRGELVERDQVERVAGESFTTLRLLLGNISDTAAACVPAEYRGIVASEVRDVVDNALRTTRHALGRTFDPTGKREIDDTLGDVLRFLVELPCRVAQPERKQPDRDRIRKRLVKLCDRLVRDVRARFAVAAAS